MQDTSQPFDSQSVDSQSSGLLNSFAIPKVPVESVDSIRQRLDELEELAAKLNSEDHYDVESDDLVLPKDFALSIVVPVFNEEATVRSMVARLVGLPLPTQIIIVDDGSHDSTAEILKDLDALPNIKVILKPKNEGKGAAVRTGFEQATGNVILVQDADLEYDPRDIPRLLKPIVEGEADVVYGSRFLDRRGAGSSAVHRFGNRVLTTISNLTTGLHLTDMETCYKLIRRDALQGMSLKQNRFGFEPEITAKIARRKLRISELPIRYNARDWSDGKKIGVKDGISALVCILRYAWFD